MVKEPRLNQFAFLFFIFALSAVFVPNTFAKDRILIGQSDLIGEEEDIENLVVVGGSVEVAGEVETLVVVGSKVLLKSTARVTKEFVRVGSKIDSEPGAQVTAKESVSVFSGRLTSDKKGHFEWQSSDDSGLSQFRDFFDRIDDFSILQLWLSLWGKLLRIALLLGFSWAAYEFSPRLQTQIQVRMSESPIFCFFSGVFLVIFSAFVCVALVISLVGILALPFFLLLCLLLTSFGYIHVAQTIGELIPRLRDLKSPFLAITIGLVVIEGLQYLPYFSFLNPIIYLTAFGAAFSALQGARRVVVVQARGSQSQ